MQAGTPASSTNKVRPKPIEPDVSTNNGGFRAVPTPPVVQPPPAPVPEVKPVVEKKVIPPEKTPVIPTEPTTAPIMMKSAWRPDANGNYWSRMPDGREFFSPMQSSLVGYGDPINK